MKKVFLILTAAFIAVAFAGAETSVLIDFNLLQADTTVADEEEPSQNERTMMDYSSVAGSSYTDEQKELMQTSLAIPNWDVVLNSSARTVESQRVSKAKPAHVNGSSPKYADETILGIRALFPAGPYNANVTIKPPFEIPAYEELDDSDEENEGLTRFEGGYGIVKNVGTIKSVAVNVRGLNFPHRLYVLLSNESHEQMKIDMGTLDFDGWRTLIWDNPQYVSDVRNRELRIYPLYPQSVPFYRFDGFVVARDGSHVGGDFIGYFKDVQMIYDKATLEQESDIDHEDLWGIIGDRETKRKTVEMSRFGDTQVLRYLETQKQAPADESFRSDNSGSDDGQSSDASNTANAR